MVCGKFFSWQICCLLNNIEFIARNCWKDYVCDFIAVSPLTWRTDHVRVFC